MTKFIREIPTTAMEKEFIIQSVVSFLADQGPFIAVNKAWLREWARQWWPRHSLPCSVEQCKYARPKALSTASAIHDVAYHASIQIIEYFIQNCPDTKYTLMRMVVRSGRRDIIESLLTQRLMEREQLILYLYQYGTYDLCAYFELEKLTTLSYKRAMTGAAFYVLDKLKDVKDSFDCWLRPELFTAEEELWAVARVATRVESSILWRAQFIDVIANRSLAITEYLLNEWPTFPRAMMASYSIQVLELLYKRNPGQLRDLETYCYNTSIPNHLEAVEWLVVHGAPITPNTWLCLSGNYCCRSAHAWNRAQFYELMNRITASIPPLELYRNALDMPVELLEKMYHCYRQVPDLRNQSIGDRVDILHWLKSHGMIHKFSAPQDSLEVMKWHEMNSDRANWWLRSPLGKTYDFERVKWLHARGRVKTLCARHCPNWRMIEWARANGIKVKNMKRAL